MYFVSLLQLLFGLLLSILLDYMLSPIHHHFHALQWGLGQNPTVALGLFCFFPFSRTLGCFYMSVHIYSSSKGAKIQGKLVRQDDGLLSYIKWQRELAYSTL